MSASWLAPPLDLRTVCIRLKAAVEEREAFYKLTPNTVLEIPDAPHPLDSRAPGRFPLAFAETLFQRIITLIDNSYDPRDFGSWCGFHTFADSGVLTSPDWPGFEAFGIDGAAFCRRRPYRWADRDGFFSAAADVLDRITLYPDPPRFSTGGKNSGQVFGLDAELSIADLVSGNTVGRNYQPSGQSLALTLAGGGTAYCHYGTARNWRRDVSDATASNWSIYYDASVGQPGTAIRRGAGVELRGEFQLRLCVRFSVTGRAAEECTQTLTIRPGGVSDAPDVSAWQPYLAPAPGSDRLEAALTFGNEEILLRPENYPPLPYQYLD